MPPLGEGKKVLRTACAETGQFNNRNWGAPLLFHTQGRNFAESAFKGNYLMTELKCVDCCLGLMSHHTQRIRKVIYEQS